MAQPFNAPRVNFTKSNNSNKPQHIKPKPPIKDLFHELLGKQVVCIQKGAIKVEGGFHSYEKGVMLFIASKITFNCFKDDTQTILLESVMVDRTSIQMMYEDKKCAN